MVSRETITNACDNILRYLAENHPNTFIPLGRLFELLNLNLDDLPSALATLKTNGHIEEQVNPYQYANIKITPEAIDFINRTSYDECRDNGVVKIIGSLSTEGLPTRHHIRPLVRKDLTNPRIQTTSNHKETSPPKRSVLEKLYWISGIILGLIGLYEFVLKRFFHF